MFRKLIFLGLIIFLILKMSQRKPIPQKRPSSPFDVLGISTDATTDQIKEAHRTLSKRYHPDLTATQDKASQQQAAQKMALINAAYADLKKLRGFQ